MLISLILFILFLLIAYWFFAPVKPVQATPRKRVAKAHCKRIKHIAPFYPSALDEFGF